MIELITRQFYPEDDEDINLVLDFVRSMSGCSSAQIFEDHIIAVFRVKII